MPAKPPVSAPVSRTTRQQIAHVAGGAGKQRAPDRATDQRSWLTERGVYTVQPVPSTAADLAVQRRPALLVNLSSSSLIRCSLITRLFSGWMRIPGCSDEFRWSCCLARPGRTLQRDRLTALAAAGCAAGKLGQPTAKRDYRPAAISCGRVLRLLLLGRRLERRCEAAEQSYTDPYSLRDWMEVLARRRAVMEQRMLGKRL